MEKALCLCLGLLHLEMADLIGNNKKRLSISLSFFAPNDQTPKKSPKSFQPDRVVGLGIVAALGETGPTHDPFFTAKKSSPAAVLAVSPRSNPIPIRNSGSIIGDPNLKKGAGDDDDMELSEEYTCVIFHIGDNLIKKREYFDGVLANETHTTTTYWGGGEEVAVEKAASFQAADFLKSCYLCKKHLHGLDIFMYRGEKAFCSAECRCKQMAIDEHKEKERQKEKCGSLGAGAAMMMSMVVNKPSSDFSSATPCSSPMQFIAGVAAA